MEGSKASWSFFEHVKVIAWRRFLRWRSNFISESNLKQLEVSVRVINDLSHFISVKVAGFGAQFG